MITPPTRLTGNIKIKINETNDMWTTLRILNAFAMSQTDAMPRKAMGRCLVREYLHSALQALATLRVTEKTKWPSHTEHSQSQAEIFITACKSFGLCLATVTRHRLAWGREQLLLTASCRKYDSTFKTLAEAGVLFGLLDISELNIYRSIRWKCLSAKSITPVHLLFDSYER